MPNTASEMDVLSMSQSIRNFFNQKLVTPEVGGDWTKMPKPKSMLDEITKWVRSEKKDNDANVSMSQVYAIQREFKGGSEPSYTMSEFLDLLRGDAAIDSKQAEFIRQGTTMGIKMSKDQLRLLEEFDNVEKIKKDVLPEIKKILAEV